MPDTITWQGYLSDPDTGAPINDTYGVTAALFESAEGGAPWCSEELDEVRFARGRFALELGAGCARDRRLCRRAAPAAG